MSIVYVTKKTLGAELKKEFHLTLWNLDRQHLNSTKFSQPVR